MQSDANLVKTVYQEIHNRKDGTRFRTTASLTRFGALAVFVWNESTNETVWQGENILQARAWVRGEVLTDKSDSEQVYGDARDSQDVNLFWA